MAYNKKGKGKRKSERGAALVLIAFFGAAAALGVEAVSQYGAGEYQEAADKVKVFMTEPVAPCVAYGPVTDPAVKVCD